MSDAAVDRGAWTRLTELGVLRATGADAVAFLQGQLSNDLARLERERALLASLNTPQGRVVAVLRLVQRRDGIMAILPAALVAPVIERLRKYVLRAKVALHDESARWAVAGLLDVAAGDADSNPQTATDEFSVHALPGRAGRQLLIGPSDALESVASRLAPGATSADRWRLAAIELGEPQVYPATSDVFVAQMLNLDLVDGVSFTKGCYTGQEIIARTQHRGRIKRRMLRYRLAGAAALKPGDTVQIEQRAGRVVEFAAKSASEGEILAVMSLEGAPHTYAADLPAERLPLPYSIPDLD
jgi:folate-binding protein YgfZ